MRPRIMASTALGEKVKPLPGLSADLRCGAELRYRIVPDPDSISMEHGTCIRGQTVKACASIGGWPFAKRQLAGCVYYPAPKSRCGFIYMIYLFIYLFI